MQRTDKYHLISLSQLGVRFTEQLPISLVDQYQDPRSDCALVVCGDEHFALAFRGAGGGRKEQGCEVLD